MTNSEKYKRASEILRPSENMDIMRFVEEKEMEKKRNKNALRKAAAVFAAFIVVIGLGTVAYASDLGGIRKPIKVWLHGDLKEVVIEQVGDGQFEVRYPDGSVRGCGGLTARDGEMVGVTLEEMEEHLLTEVEAVRDENGKCWVYIRDHRIDVTDQIVEEGYAQVKVKDGVIADYITVVFYENGGCGVSRNSFGFTSPEELLENTR